MLRMLAEGGPTRAIAERRSTSIRAGIEAPDHREALTASKP